MERRKFIAGLGSVTAAGAAGIGTGAFASAEVERDASVSVVADEDAYLALNDTSEFAETDADGELYLDFSATTNTGDGDGTDNGSGLPANSEMEFVDVFEIQNQGENTVVVAADLEFPSGHISCPSVWASSGADAPTGLSVWIDNGSFNNLENEFAPRRTNSNAGYELSPGESVGVAIQVNTGDAPPTSYSGEMTVVAVDPNNPASGNT